MQSSDRPRKIDDDLTSRLRGLFAAVPGREVARVQRCHRPMARARTLACGAGRGQ